MAKTRTLVIGAGIFGLTAALELKRRGHAVTEADAGDAFNWLFDHNMECYNFLICNF